MHFTTKIAGLCVAIACFAGMSAQASPLEPRAPASVVFFPLPVFAGDSYGLNPVPNGVNTLPAEWQEAVQSLIVGTGWKCQFFNGPNGNGESIILQGKNPIILPPYSRNIKSFQCSQATI